MKHLISVFLLINISGVVFAQKTAYIPLYLLDTTVVDGQQFSWSKTAESDNFIVIWGDSAGVDPLMANNPDLIFDPANILDTMETIFQAFKDLGFALDTVGTNLNEFKVPIIMLNTFGPSGVNGWAFGGDADGVIGAFWAHPLAMQDGAVAAHEFTHSLQAQVNIDYRTTNSLGIVWQNSGIFWETHANFMRNILYPWAATSILMDLYGMESWGQWKNTYENYHLLYAIKEEDGIDIINRMWRESYSEEYPIAAYKRLMNLNQEDLNDKMYKYARRMATLDFSANDIGFYMRENRNFHLSFDMSSVQRVYTILKKNPENPSHYFVPYELAPEEYGYNIIPLNHIEDSCAVIIKFKGHTDANSFAGWRYGFVTSLPDGTISRYSEMYSAEEEVIGFSILPEEDQMYLVVMGAPNAITTSPEHDTWKGFPKQYRFPYELTVTGANPEGYQDPQNFRSHIKVEGQTHANGGGWVANSSNVENSVYVSPYAMVLGNSNLSGDVQIQDQAIIQDATISDNVIVKDNAFVLRGNLSEDAIIGGVSFVENCIVYENALIDMRARVSNYELHGDIHVGGDVIVYNTTGKCNNGVYFRMVNYFADNLLECDGRTESHPDNFDVNNKISLFGAGQMNMSCDCSTYPNCLSVGVKEIQKDDDVIVVYPNPTSNELSIELTEGFPNGCKVIVYNQMGTEWLNTFSRERLFTIDLSIFPSGFYTLLISDNINSTYKKFQILK